MSFEKGKKPGENKSQKQGRYCILGEISGFGISGFACELGSNNVLFKCDVEI